MKKQSKLSNFFTNKSVSEISKVDFNNNNTVIKKNDENLPPANINNELCINTGLNLTDLLNPDWKSVLKSEFSKDYFLRLKRFVNLEYASKKVFPEYSNIFSWSHFTKPDEVKVVILGQDPYHGVNQAHGLCFSVLKPTPPPPSLVNIYKELESDIEGFKRPIGSGDLTKWAKSGVLLLNAVLTVRSGEPNSHKDHGWEEFTDAIISYLNKLDNRPIIFMLWGADAQRKCKQVCSKTNLILKAPHPSPLSAHRGFFGCKHFSIANDFLIKNEISPIDWKLS